MLLRDEQVAREPGVDAIFHARQLARHVRSIAKRARDPRHGTSMNSGAGGGGGGEVRLTVYSGADGCTSARVSTSFRRVGRRRWAVPGSTFVWRRYVALRASSPVEASRRQLKELTDARGRDVDANRDACVRRAGAGVLRRAN